MCKLQWNSTFVQEWDMQLGWEVTVSEYPLENAPAPEFQFASDKKGTWHNNHKPEHRALNVN